MAREAIREAVARALFKWFADWDEQLRGIRKGMRRLRAMRLLQSSELERNEVARLWATLVAVENAMNAGWLVPGVPSIKVELC